MRLLDCLVLALATLHLRMQVATGQELEFQFDNGQLSQCRRLFAVVDGVPVEEAGFLCLNIDPLVTDSIQVNYATSNGWLMEETIAWFNADLEQLPTDKDEAPELKDFPYTGEDSIDPDAPVSSYSFDLPVEEVGVAACTAQDTVGTDVLGVAFAALVREEEQADGWADGIIPEDPEADLWTLFNFTLQCVQAVPLTPSPTTMPPTTLPPTTPAPLPTTPPPTTPPPTTPAPTPSSNLLEDGAICDADIQCKSGACSTERFCLFSNGSQCINNDSCASTTCINGICNTCQGATDGQASTSILTKEVIDRSFVAGELIHALNMGFYDNPPTSVSPSLITLFNANTDDPAMVAKVDGVCYGVFAPNETADLTTFPTTPLTTFSQTCQIHQRAYSAYFTNERQFLELQLAQCASTCAPAEGGVFPVGGVQPLAISNQIVSVSLYDKACPIVLTGHGIGGGAAIVSSIMLADLQPTVITMGAPRTVSPDCSLMKSTARAQRHYRHVNLAYVPSYDTYLFDAVPQLGDGRLVHYGSPILLDEMETLVLRLNDNTTRAHIYDSTMDPNNDVNLPSQLSVYQERLSGLTLESCFPLPTAAAWQDGHWCDNDDICVSDRCRPFLTLGGDTSVGICAQQLPDDELCQDNGDCLSGLCNAGRCLGGGNASPPPATPPPPVPAPATPAPGTPTPLNPPATPLPATPAPGTPSPAPGTPAPGPLSGACAACQLDADCQSGVCVAFDVPGAPGGITTVCAETAQGTMSNGCFCAENNNAQCTDGRCEADSSASFWLCIAPQPPCSTCDEDSDCLSSNCEQGLCGLQSGGLPPECGSPETPLPAVVCEFCDANTPCTEAASGAVCMMEVCTQPDGLIETGCPCPPRGGDANCQSGRCELVDLLSICVEPLDVGGTCDEDSDCMSGNCDFAVGACAAGAITPLSVSAGQPCITGTQCSSGSCTLKCDTASSCGCACPFWSCD